MQHEPREVGGRVGVVKDELRIGRLLHEEQVRLSQGVPSRWRRRHSCGRCCAPLSLHRLGGLRRLGCCLIWRCCWCCAAGDRHVEASVCLRQA